MKKWYVLRLLRDKDYQRCKVGIWLRKIVICNSKINESDFLNSSKVPGTWMMKII